MGLKLTRPHKIEYYECDLQKNVTLPMLISILIKVGGAQTNELTDPKILEDKNLGWIITQYEMKINALPKQEAIVYITTEADSYNKYFCYRKFWMYDDQGNLLVELLSVFSLMDLNKRKIEPITDEIIAPYQAEKTTKLKRFPKMASVENDEFQKHYQVRYFDLDGNGHVNNAHYFDWMLDTLPYEFLQNMEPKEMEIKFEKEVQYGDEVCSIAQYDEDLKQTRHKICHKDTNELFAQALITWKEINKDED